MGVEEGGVEICEGGVRAVVMKLRDEDGMVWRSVWVVGRDGNEMLAVLLGSVCCVLRLL